MKTTRRRSVHSSTPPRVTKLNLMRRVDEAKASSSNRTWPYPYQHKERPITTSQTLYQGLSVGTAFRDKLLHSGLSWPRLWSLPPKHPSKEKNDPGTRVGKIPSHQRKTKLTKQTQNQLNVPTNTALTHTLKRVRLPQAAR